MIWAEPNKVESTKPPVAGIGPAAVRVKLDLKISTVRAWLAKRKLPRVNCGGAVRIPADAIAQFIQKGTAPAGEEGR